MLRATVPATSANLGPGFDTLGLAVELRLEVRLTPSATDGFVYRGDGNVANTADNLVHRGFRAAYERLGQTPPTVTFEVSNPIPLARGLGSSSAALVAGAALADAMLDNQLGADGILQLTAAIEGHPDNVAPAVYGGFTVSAADATGTYHSASLPVPPSWRLLFGVPAFELSTAQARQVVPTTVALADALRTSSRAALWVAAVAQDRPELLRAASRDVLHQPHRAPLVPGFLQACDDALAHGAYAVFLSGAGPTVGVVCAPDHEAGCRAALERFVGAAGRVLAPRPATGFTVQKC